MGELSPYYILKMNVKSMEVISKSGGFQITKPLVVEAVLHCAQRFDPVKLDQIKQRMWDDLIAENGWTTSSKMKQAAKFDEPIEVEHGCKPITYRI